MRMYLLCFHAYLLLIEAGGFSWSLACDHFAHLGMNGGFVISPGTSVSSDAEMKADVFT